MRKYFGTALPDAKDVRTAANSAAHAARGVAAQLEDWAKAGRASQKSNATAIVGAASLGIGAIAGGLYALWRNKERITGISALEAWWHRDSKPVGRTVAVSARTKQSRRAAANKMSAVNGEKSKPQAKRTKGARRARSQPSAEA